MSDNQTASNTAEKAPGPDAPGHGEHGHGDHGLGHVTSIKFNIGILVALLILTGLTVGVTYLPSMGATVDIVIALGIAFVKATLVALFFMHLYWDRPFNLFILVASLFFVALFLGFCMMDTREYRHTLDDVPDIVQEKIEAAKVKNANATH